MFFNDPTAILFPTPFIYQYILKDNVWKQKFHVLSSYIFTSDTIERTSLTNA